MTNNPPRQGARWGDDPPPEPEPSKPQLYLDLSNRYGEANLQRALDIQHLVRTEYPHLKINELGELATAADILEFTQKWVKFAAEDGRVHPMSKALDLLSEQIGSILMDDPDCLKFSKYMIFFGDEHRGSIAKKDIARRQKKHQETENTKNIVFFGIPVVSAVSGFLWATSFIDETWEAFVGAAAFGVFGYFASVILFYFVDRR